MTMALYALATHLVTDEQLPFDRLRVIVAQVVEAGFDVIQLRAKRATARELLTQLKALADVIQGRAALIVNDRVDVVLAAREAGIRVDGVHLGQADLPPTTARR
jgi:thiamine monophosphate synthase